jgi:hypothetical protein
MTAFFGYCVDLSGAAMPQNRKISRHIVLSFFLILRERSINSYTRTCIIPQCELYYTVCNAMENHREKSSENSFLSSQNFDSNGGDLDIVEMIVFWDLSGLPFHAADCKFRLPFLHVYRDDGIIMERWWRYASKRGIRAYIHQLLAIH